MDRPVNKTALLAALVIAAAGVGFSARAQESKSESKAESNAETKAESKNNEAFQQRLFGRTASGTEIHACFSRVYDTAHLAQHPRQNVRTMLLLVKASSDSDQPTYALRLGVTFRKSGAHFESAGSCGSIHDAGEAGGSAAAVHCGVDCDGGSIDVAIKDAKSVLVSIPTGARIWRAGSDNDSDSDKAKRFGSDDKVFRLDKAALTECLRLADDSKEKAAMRRGQ
jgi:ribosomal protein L12E/L44/L45/RPP1/RPP2